MTDICASVLLASGWLKPRELADIPREQWRPALIDAMTRCGVGDARVLQAKLNSELALSATIYMHLRDVGIHPRELAAMSPATRREMLLTEIHERQGTPIDSMRDCDDRRIVTIAASGRLRDRLGPLAAGLEDIGDAAPVTYGLTDDGGRAMDTLKVLRLADDDYLGIYHIWVEDVFHLQVAASNDLVDWTRIAELGEHNHQGDIQRMGDGFLVANEEDRPRRGNRLRFRYFESLEKLTANKPLHDKSIPRSLSKLNEGTPDIRLIEGQDPAESAILVGFHYFRRSGIKRKVDRLAQGVLTGFDRWTPLVDTMANEAITSMGYRGNIGGRCSFRWDGESWYIQEAQLRWKDWSSWRVLLGNGRSYIQLEPRTSGASQSFANPCLTLLTDNSYAAAFFLPRQGNFEDEAGELTYRFSID
jgi:hypothetical protein